MVLKCIRFLSLKGSIPFSNQFGRDYASCECLYNSALFLEVTQNIFFKWIDPEQDLQIIADVIYSFYNTEFDVREKGSPRKENYVRGRLSCVGKIQVQRYGACLPPQGILSILRR